MMNDWLTARGPVAFSLHAVSTSNIDSDIHSCMGKNDMIYPHSNLLLSEPHDQNGQDSQ